MKNLAIAYSMKKKAKKMADGGDVQGSPVFGGKKMPSAAGDTSPAQDAKNAGLSFDPYGKVKKMAHGGQIAEMEDRADVRGVHKQSHFSSEGISRAGASARNSNDMASKNGSDAMASSKRGHERVLGEMKSMKKPNLYADGGFITDNYQSPASGRGQTHPDLGYHEEESGFVDHMGNVQRPDRAAVAEDDKDLNQHGAREVGSYGQDEPFPAGPEAYLGSDIVDRIMNKRLNEKGLPSHEAEQHYSEGGKVANSDLPIADFMPNEFDDLHLRDDLSSTYGDDDNSGDALGNAQEDEDRNDIIARVMRSRAKKDRNPRPA
jgi:hypothetical protein